MVVTTPTGMYLRAEGTRNLGQSSLDRCVYVLVGRREAERPRRQLPTHLLERRDEEHAFVRCEQAHRSEHLHVRTGALDVVVRQATIDRQADGERQQLIRWSFPEAAMPQRLRRRLVRVGHFAPPCRRAQVSTERPQRRTKPSAS